VSRHEPIQEQHIRTMNEIAAILDTVFKGYGFTLMIFDLNAIDNGRMNYISNARRDDMVTAMKEFIAASEGRAHEAPAQKQ
jgi:hypothetical protein